MIEKNTKYRKPWEVPVPKTYDVKKAFENLAEGRESKRIQEEYNKTVKLLDLTNRFRNKKEESS